VAIDVVVPPLGESSGGAKLSTWLKQEGDTVTAGETIAEIETDKTIVEVVAPADGTLQSILVPVGGTDLADGRALAIIGAAAAADRTSVDPVARPHPPYEEAAPPRTAAVRRPGAVEPTNTTRRPGAAERTIARGGPGDPAATPLASRMAAVLDVDLAEITGTGASGKISKADIERFVSGGFASPESPLGGTRPTYETGTYEERPLSPMRKVTASRMQQAKQTIPHFYLSAECSVDALIDAQVRMSAAHSASAEASADKPQTKLTLTDFVIRAVAVAMREVPDANAAWADGTVRVYDRVDVAVAVNTPRGLVTPIVRDAANKSIDQIAGEFRALTSRARDGALTPPEYTGGTVTISNLGMFGVDSLFAILNPPQSCIIGIGAVEEKPVVRDGQITIGSVMTVTLSADHRVLDGATGATLLRAVKRAMEEPSRLIG
jgi:pyruvate dehydrogenase E2 component (dihydrolipoamide acetyltransferase)